MMRLLVPLAALLLCFASPSASQCVNVPSDDGTPLNTCIWWTKAGHQKPALMDRSPYSHVGLELIAVAFGLLEDLVGVEQDQRGTGFSGGDFAIWHDAGVDSFATQAWIANQSWSNGEVYTVGASADGLAEFMTLTKPSPHQAGQLVVFAGTKGYEILYPGHAFRQQLAEKWLQGTVPKQAAKLIELVKSKETPDQWWDEIDVTGDFSSVTWPTVMWAGWYDIFSSSNLISFDGYQKGAAPGHTGKAKIVVDPLGHCQAGAKYFPNHLIEGRAVLPILLGWELFKNESTVAEGVKAVTFYVMGAYDEKGAPGNYWTTLDDWPEPSPTPYYLGAGGTLGTDAPSGDAAGTQAFVYDPADPVPTLGGNNLELPCGPQLQNTNEQRPDVLTFTTAPLTEAVYITGAVSASVWLSSNATDTDVTAMLTDVYPNGDSRQIQDGIFRMRWRNCERECKPEPMEAGQAYEATVDMWNTSYAFAPGHSIRVDISSSNYPRFSKNGNVARYLNETGPDAVAANTVHWSDSQPSFVTLPVVTADQMPPAFVVYDEEGRDTGRVRFSNADNYDEMVERAKVLEKYVQTVSLGSPLRG